MEDPLELLTQEALALYEAGQLEASEALLTTALAKAPEDATALYLLGCIASDRNDHAGAVPRLRAALETNPQFLQALLLLGDSLLTLGAWAEAAERLRQALALQPDLIEARNSLGIALYELGNYAEAAQTFRDTLSLDPHHASALLGLDAAQVSLALARIALGEVQSAIQELGGGAGYAPDQHLTYAGNGESALAEERHEEALAWFARSAACRPDEPNSFSALGLVFARMGRFEVAESCFRHALTLAPNRADILSNLGAVLSEQGRPHDGLGYLKRAVQLDRGDAVAWRNLTRTALLIGEHQEITKACKVLLLLEPNDAVAAHDLGYALFNLGQYEAASGAYRRAIALRPDYGAAYGGLSAQLRLLGRLDEAISVCRQVLAMNLAAADVSGLLHHLYAALLQQGDFEQGWKTYETWREASGFKVRPFVQPRWDGTPVPGKTLLVYADHGFGDAIQFLRFLPLAAQRSEARLVVECQAELLPLVAASFDVDLLIARRSLDTVPDTPFDAQIGLMSLCGALDCGPRDLPGAGGYLRAPALSARRWKERLSAYPGLKIGICWMGDPSNQYNAWRSCRLQNFAPLADVTELTFFSLQVGAGAEQITEAPEGMPLIDLSSELRDFGETAAAMTNLDLVITVETATAHLAGALNVPTWTALPVGAPWMWPRAQEDTPWYPGMRLFWQSEAGDWESVFQRMADALRSFAAGTGPLSNL